MTSSASASLQRFRDALAADDVQTMWTALDAAALDLQLTSWREIRIPGAGVHVPLLREAAEKGASKCFVSLTERLYERTFWSGLDEEERRMKSAAFVLPLGSLYDKLVENSSEDQARERLADAFIAFFGKDEDPEKRSMRSLTVCPPRLRARARRLALALSKRRSQLLFQSRCARLRAGASKHSRARAAASIRLLSHLVKSGSVGEAS